jgi:DNA-binding NtrC family response regulator
MVYPFHLPRKDVDKKSTQCSMARLKAPTTRSMIAPTRVLIVDDTAEFLRETSAALRPHFRISTCSSPLRALRMVAKGRADLLITTLVMRELDGFEVIRRVRGLGSDLPIIMVTGRGDENSAVEAMRVGANDYLNRPVQPDELVARVRRAILRPGRKAGGGRQSGVPVVVTQDSLMLQALDLCTRAARSDSRVLILGETGTGKELFAKTIHASSKRNGRPMVEVNCAAIPANLMESELFGHEKGAFTGATERRIGRFEDAGDGTLFLDEIGELNHGLQSKLLRVLQSGEFSRVGSPKVLHSGARIVAATNRDLEQESLAGRFRADLYYRLNVVAIPVPPLRERLGDVPVLVDFFNRKFSADSAKPLVFSDAVMTLLNEYHWPGNVRELEHLIERLVVLSVGEVVRVSDLPVYFRKAAASPPAPGEGRPSYEDARKEFDLGYFGSLIRHAGGNHAAAARMAAMDRSQFFRKITALGLRERKLPDKC